MVAGIRSYLAALGRDVEKDTRKGKIVLSSEQGHLVDGQFDPQRMLASLEEAHDTALCDGFARLWASGDMSWEFGPEQNFEKLVDYERKLEIILQAHSTLCGICQYHVDKLPRNIVSDGFTSHRRCTSTKRWSG